MMPFDPIAEMVRLQALYEAYPGAFQAAGVVVLGLFTYFAVIEIAARVAR